MPVTWTSPGNFSTGRPGSGHADQPDAIPSASPVDRRRSPVPPPSDRGQRQQRRYAKAFTPRAWPVERRDHNRAPLHPLDIKFLADLRWMGETGPWAVPVHSIGARHGHAATSPEPCPARRGPVPATKTSHGAAIAHALRTRWWPRFLLAGLVLAVVGVTLLSGVAQAAVAFLGVLVFLEIFKRLAIG